MASEDNPILQYQQKGGTTTSSGDQLAQLENVLRHFQISIAEANDLVVLQDYEIVIIADDSGSMALPAPPAEERTLGVPNASRWDELKQTVALIVEIGNCFDKSGLDIYFLNRPKLKGVKSTSDPSFFRAFNNEPNGSTPLTETLSLVVKECGGEKPVLLFILTDGVPNGGPDRFCQELRRLVQKKSTHCTFKVQIMACTSDNDAIDYLNKIDRDFSEIDVTDDYYSERKEVLRAQKVNEFSRADWCMKAMLGPVSRKFDCLDEITHSHEVLCDFGSQLGCTVQ